MRARFLSQQGLLRTGVHWRALRQQGPSKAPSCVTLPTRAQRSPYPLRHPARRLKTLKGPKSTYSKRAFDNPRAVWLQSGFRLFRATRVLKKEAIFLIFSYLECCPRVCCTQWGSKKKNM